MSHTSSSRQKKKIQLRVFQKVVKHSGSERHIRFSGISNAAAWLWSSSNWKLHILTKTVRKMEVIRERYITLTFTLVLLRALLADMQI